MSRAVVIFGGLGGIGRAFAAALGPRLSPSESLFVTTRRRQGESVAGAQILEGIDVCDERTIARASGLVKEACPEGVKLLINCAGILHEDSKRPERTVERVDRDWMARNMEINAIGPALIAKHFAPMLGADAKLVTLSARVGSIGDNGLGGWISYRASKAAQNQITRTVAIELKRKKVMCIGIHPGTVQTQLSDPFKVAPSKLFTPDLAVAKMLKVIDNLTLEQTGQVFAYDGTVIPW